MTFEIEKNQVYIKSSYIKMVQYNENEILIFDKINDTYLGVEGAAMDILKKYNSEFTLMDIILDFDLTNEIDLNNAKEAIVILENEKIIFKKDVLK